MIGDERFPDIEEIDVNAARRYSVDRLRKSAMPFDALDEQQQRQRDASLHAAETSAEFEREAIDRAIDSMGKVLDRKPREISTVDRRF